MKIQVQSQPVKFIEANINRFNKALAAHLGCSTMDILCTQDTPQKKIAVFILSVVYKMPSLRISQLYCINRIYVATVVRECANCTASAELADLVHAVLNKMEEFIEAEEYAHPCK